jgi:hypothetical protein
MAHILNKNPRAGYYHIRGHYFYASNSTYELTLLSVDNSVIFHEVLVSVSDETRHETGSVVRVNEHGSLFKVNVLKRWYLRTLSRLMLTKARVPA